LDLIQRKEPKTYCASQRNVLANVRFGSKADIWAVHRHVRFTPKSGHFHFQLSGALGDDVDDLKRHHHFAGLIDYLNERGNRAAIGL
jgi:hypothetical protein